MSIRSGALPKRQRPTRTTSSEVDEDDASLASDLTDNSVQTAVSHAPRLPKRLVDFFCVVGVDRTPAAGTDPPLEPPQDTHLVPTVLDCYPRRRPDMEGPPPQMARFCVPDSLRQTKQQQPPPPPPRLWTTVLTSANGHQLYATILTFYETRINKKYPSAKDDACFEGSSCSCTCHPKSLVILSHYAAFDVFRQFLQQLYRIFASGTSPLPLERFIAHFVHHVPLPPAGKAVVQWEGFLQNAKPVEIARPPPNQLPAVNVSYQPLFSALSVANILVVWGLLLQEGRVVFLSEHAGLLTPVTTALQSLLFPLTWQGMYIPILPADDMWDVLDAPVPYMMGLHRRYWEENRENRPAGVVFVDLDQDIVHLGCNSDNRQQEAHSSRLPDLPGSQVMELKVLLEELADHLYLPTVCGRKGRIMTAHGQVLKNSERPPYSQMTCLPNYKLNNPNQVEDHRHFILSTAEQVLVDDDKAPLQYRDFIRNGQREPLLTKKKARAETMAIAKPNTSVVSSMKRATRVWQAHADRVMAFAGQPYATSNPFNAGDTSRTLKKTRVQRAKNLYEMDPDKDVRGFSASAVRQAFLSFFVKLLARYKNFLQVGRTGEIRLNKDAFVRDLRHLSTPSRQFMAELAGTQMLERFIHDRRRRKLLFDEHIVKERNRGTDAKHQQPTPFLDDARWNVRKTLHPQSPNARGVSGRKVYKFDTFPNLDEKEFAMATAPPPRSLWTTLCEGSLCSACLCWPMS